MANVHTVEVRFEADKARREAAQFDRSMGKLDKQAGGLGNTFKKLSALAGALGFAVAARDMAQTIVATEQMKASLQTMTGSMENANAAFGALNEFAKTTPFTMDQSVNAFVKMKSLGLEPTAEALTSFGNTASAMGKDLNDMIEAVADASTGEFERLKEFGIVARSQGDEVSMVFQGVTTTIGKNSEEITEYLQSIGKEKFGDAMALQMERLPGKLSNLRDNVQNLWRAFGDAGVTEALGDIVSATAGFVEDMTKLVTSGFAKETISILLTGWVMVYDRAFTFIANAWRDRQGEMVDIGQQAADLTAQQQLTWAENITAAFATMPATIMTGIEIIVEAFAGLLYYLTEQGQAIGSVFDVGVAQIQRGFEFAWENIRLGFIELLGWFKDAALGFAVNLPDGGALGALKEQLIGYGVAAGEAGDAEANMRAEMEASASAHADRIDDLINEGNLNSANAAQALQDMETIIFALGAEDVALKDLTAERIVNARAMLDQVVAGKSWKEILDGLAEGTEETTDGTKDMTKALTELGRLKAIIDPSQKAINKLTKEMKALDKVRKEFEDDGKFFGDAFWEDMADGLERAIMGTESLAQSMQQVGNLAGDALRTVQSSVTDGSEAYEVLNKAIQAANIVAAVGAILNQAQGDPYSAPARMAAMAGLVASLGVAVANFGATAGFSDTAARRQEEQGTGSILGDAEAKSESIMKASEITADATTALVGINRGMLDALKTMVSGIGNATGTIARGGDIDFSGMPDTDFSSINGLTGAMAGGGITSILTAGTWLAGPLFGVIGTIIGGAIGSLVGKLLGGKSKITDEGIAVLSGTMGELIDGTLIKAYQEVKYKKWRFGSTKTREELGDLKDDAAAQIGLVFEAIGDAVREGALALGLDADLIQERMEAFTIEEQRISLKDLTAEEQAAELEAVFSKIFDDLAGAVVPFIDQFQQVGEGLGETLIRVATSVQVMQEAIKQFGWAVDVVDPEKFAQMSVGLIEMAGGIDAFISKMQNFVGKFAPEEHQFKIASEALHKAFSAVGLVLPDTSAGLWELMQALDATTEEGQRQITAILDLSEHAATYYDMLEDIEARRADAMQTEIEALQYLDDLAQAVTDRFGSLKATIDDFLNPKDIDDATVILDSLMAELATAVDPAEVDRITAEIERVARSAWGALPDDMKQAMGQQFLDMLTEADRLAQDRLALIREQVVLESAILRTEIEVLMEGITTPFNAVIEDLGDAADALNDAADNLDPTAGSDAGDEDYGDFGGGDKYPGLTVPSSASLEVAANSLASEGAAWRASQAAMTAQLAAAIASIPSRIVVQAVAARTASTEFV